jgi:hypothetical protein
VLLVAMVSVVRASASSVSAAGFVGTFGLCATRHDRLMDLTGLKNHQDLKQIHKAWVEEGLAKGNPFREDRWVESLAVGGEDFVKEIWEALGVRAIGCSIIKEGEQQ